MELLDGTIGVTPTFGNNFDRFVAREIQWFTASRDAYSKTWVNSKVNHAVVYVGSVPGIANGYPQLVEARPRGASFVNYDNYGKNMIWLDTIYQAGTGTKLVPTTEQRNIIKEYAIECAQNKIGYNYLDFVAIGMAQKRFGNHEPELAKERWVQILSNDHRLICSQLVDEAYNRAKLYLFNDGRPTGLVSPADLFNLTIPDLSSVVH